MQSALIPFFETNAGLAAFLALVVVPIVSKLTAYFATASLLEQIEDVHSHPTLARRYRQKSTNWYEKGIVVTLNFFEKIYGEKKFSTRAFVTSMQIAIVYFWIAAVLALVILSIMTGAVFTEFKVEILVNLLIILICVWVSVKLFFLSGRLVSWLTLARPFVQQISGAMALEPNAPSAGWVVRLVTNRQFYRILISLSFAVAYHVLLKWIGGPLLPNSLADAVGTNSLEGYLGVSVVCLAIGVYLALGFRFIVEAGIFYPFFGALFALLFFKNDHSGFMVAVFAFLVYPVSNAVFDFISIGATRSFLSKILRDQLHFKAVVRNLTFDLLVALVSFAGFIVTTVTMISFISVFILGLFLGADAKTVRSMDPLGMAQYAGFIGELGGELPRPTPRPPLNKGEDATKPIDLKSGAEPKTGSSAEFNEVTALVVVVCLFGATTFAPSLVHLLIVCSNNYSQRTKSWSTAVSMLEAPPAQISKTWSNDVLKRIRSGHLWGWSFVLWGALIFGVVVL